MYRHFIWLAGVSLFSGTLLVTECYGAVFDSFDPSVHTRHVSGAIQVGVQLPVTSNFLIDESKITGVGLNSVALITPQHFVTATHITTSGPQVAVFRGSDGVVYEYNASTSTVLSTGTQANDIRIYTLDRPVPTSLVRPLSVVALSQSEMRGREILVTGKRSVNGSTVTTAGRNVINGITRRRFAGAVGRPTDVVEWTFDTAANGGVGSVGADEVGLAVGDSGSAVLMEFGDTIALVGTNYGIAGLPSGVSPSSDAPQYYNYASWLGGYLDQIDAVTSQTEINGQALFVNRLSVTAVPEPSSFAVLGILGVIAAVRMRSRSSRTASAD